MDLSPLTVLDQRYTVKRTLGDPGPFSISYLGEDVDAGDSFVIREFFPVDLVERPDGQTSVALRGPDAEEAFESGRDYFRKESSVLEGVSHEALPSHYDTFDANETHYRVRPRLSGLALERGLENQGTLPEKAALTIMMPILGALEAVHQNGLYHGGVSPRSIRLLHDGTVLLTGFRGAFFQLARERGTMTELVQSGTSAVEQYTPRGQQGPWTDVYAAAATICQMVTGEPIPASTDRLEGPDPLEGLLQDADVFSAPGVREALVDALTLDPSKRLQSAEALRDALAEASVRYDETASAYSILSEPAAEADAPADAEEGPSDEASVEVVAAPSEEPSPTRTGGGSTESASSGRTAVLVGLPLLLLALAGGTWMLMGSGSSTASAGDSTYRAQRSLADSLFEAGDYETAEFHYNQALELREDDPYVQRRLARLAQLRRREGRQYEQRLRQGDSLRTAADSLFMAGALGEAASQYSQALGAYYAAQSANPEGEQVRRRIQSVQERQTQIAKQQAGGGAGVSRLAEFFRERGDQQLEAGNLQAALDKYRQALEYSPENEGLRRAIADLEAQIEQEKQQTAFRSHYNEGRELLRAGQYEEAKAALEKAQSVASDSQSVDEALQEVNRLLEEQGRRTEAYEQFRARGDSLFEAGKFSEAIARYEEALALRPDDDYVQRRIEAATQEQEAMRLAREEMQEQRRKRQMLIGEDGVYKSVDQPPKVQGGLRSLTEDASYPVDAQERGLEGRVYIEAVVEADGSVREAEVLRGLGEEIDREALRVVRNAEFLPARYNGEPVPARKTVWIQFQLAD